MTIKQEIINSFSKSATSYDTLAKVQHEIGKRLLERLDYIKIEPKAVLDMGCGTAAFSKLLKKKYPNASIVSMDISHEMLKVAKKKQRWSLKRYRLCNADMEALPFKANSFDLVFSNQAVHWGSALELVFNEVNRAMCSDGLFIFSTLGPDTFKEIRQSWGKVDDFSHVNQFTDMHDVGDDLVKSFFADPVIDMEYITLKYSKLKKLFHDIKGQGVKNVTTMRRKGLTGKKAWAGFEKAYESLADSDKKYPLTYEVIYGHAWKGRMKNKGSDTFIPISSLKSKHS